jgi:hypothetical protein
MDLHVNSMTFRRPWNRLLISLQLSTGAACDPSAPVNFILQQLGCNCDSVWVFTWLRQWELRSGASSRPRAKAIL